MAAPPPVDDRFFALSPDLLCVAGFDGRFRRVNPAFSSTLGWTAEELTSAPWIDFVHPDDRDATLAAGERLTREGRKVVAFENRYRTRDGGWRWLQWTAAPHPSEGAIYAVARDVTEVREAHERVAALAREVERANAELSVANRELETFAYSVSHDLRAPLRSVAGFALVLLEDHGDALGPEGRATLDRVRAAADRMEQLIEALLDLSRVTRAEMRRGPVDLSALATAVAREVAAASPGRDVEVAVQPGMVVEGDERQLRVALQNLIGNAFKYTSKRPSAHVEVGARREGGETVHFVRDDGVGFDMAYASKLFAPFQRLHGREEFPGAGIGLATVARIVRRHGGRVWAEGAPGRGATFSFTLAPPP